jgi:hypothetical protein
MEIELTPRQTVRLYAKKTGLVFLPAGGVSLKHEEKLRAVLSPVRLPAGYDAGNAIVIDGPGEYEIGDLSVTGIPAGNGEDAGTLFRVSALDGTTVVLTAETGAAALTDEVLEGLGVTQVLISVLGSEGDGHIMEVAKAVRMISPLVVIPFAPNLPAAEMERFITELGGVTHPPERVFKSKSLTGLSEGLHVFTLSPS